MYKNIMNDLGQLRTVVSKSYIYNLIQNQTGLSIRTISHVLNHTKEQDTDSLVWLSTFVRSLVLVGKSFSWYFSLD